jgi:hypothetical protein
MSDGVAQQWLAYLEARSLLLSRIGMPSGPIPLRPPAGGVLSTSVRSTVSVQWPDGLSAINADAPIGGVDIELLGHHTFRAQFFTSTGVELISSLRSQQEAALAALGLVTSHFGISLPSTTGTVPVLNTAVETSGQLHVGLWFQGLEVIPGFPASFDFAVRRFRTPSSGATELLVNSPYATHPRARLVRESLNPALLDALTGLDRPLQDVARYASIAGAQVGLHWRVVTGVTRMVRTRGDRVYLDFLIDPLIVQNLGWPP